MFGNKKKTQEKRKFVRLNVSVEVFYAVVLGASTEAQKTLTKNVSAGGICLIVHEQLKIGDLLNLSIYLPDDKPFIVAQGQVVWVKEFKLAGERSRYDTGVEFTEINEADRKRVDKYVFSLR